MNFHPDKQLFQIASAKDRTTDPWITKPGLYLANGKASELYSWRQLKLKNELHLLQKNMGI